MYANMHTGTIKNYFNPIEPERKLNTFAICFTIENKLLLSKTNYNTKSFLYVNLCDQKKMLR